MARLLIRPGVTLEKGAALDEALLGVLPVYSHKLYDDAMARFQSHLAPATKPNLAAALLRPICIDHPDSDVCYGLPNNANLLRAAFRAEPSTCKNVTGNGAPNDCFRIDDAAVSVAIASDLLLPFVRNSIAEPNGPARFCTAGRDEARCFEALMATVEYSANLFAKQANMAYALGLVEQKSKALSTLTLPGAEKFLAQWRSKAPRAYTDPTADPTTFFLSADALRWLGANNPSFEAATEELHASVMAERLRVAKLARADLERIVKLAELDRKELKALEPVVASSVDAAIKKWHEDTARLSEDEPAAFIAQVSRLADPILLLAQQVSRLAGTAALPASSCSPSLDRISGVFNVCLGTDDKAFAAVAFRFTFAPCFSSVGDCDTAGHIDLLIKARASNGVAQSIPLPLGITNVRGTIGAADGIFRVFRPPAQTYIPQMDQVEQAVAGLLPAPFNVKLASDQIIVEDGPKVTLTVRPGFSLPDLAPLPTVRVTLGARGLAIDGDSKTTLHAAVLKLITERLPGRQISVGGLRMTLLNGVQDQTSECIAKPNASAMTLAAEANLGPVFATRPRLALEIGCNGGTRLSFQKDTAQRLIGEVVSKLPTGLGVTLYATDIVADGTRLQFDIKISDACSKTVTLDLASLKDLSSAGEQVTSALATCAAVAAAKKTGIAELKLAGFDLIPDGDRACTADLPTIGRICLSPLSNLSKVPRGKIRVEDDGKLVSQVRSRLASVSPIVGIIRMASDGRLVLPLQVTLPGLAQPLAADIPLGVDLNLAAAVNAPLAAAINAKIGSTGRIGPIDLTSIQAKGTAQGIVINGRVTYGGVGALVDIQVLPSFKITAHKPNIGQLIAQLSAKILGDAPAVDIITGADGVPTLVWPIKVKAPLFDTAFEASTVVRARANGELRLGAVSAALPGWLIVGSFAIGRARIDIDLDHPENVALGALMSVAPGEGTSDLARLQATIRHDAKRNRVDMEGDLALVSIPLARSIGYWDYRRGLLDLQMSPATSLLPLPQGRLVVDGPDCSIIGNASVTLLGARLADATAGFLLGSACKRGRPAAEDMASKMTMCGDRGALGVLCLIGKVKLGDITEVEGRYASRLDGLHPLVQAKFGLLGDRIVVQAHLTTVRARLSADVLHILKATLSFPTLGGLNESAVADLFLNLLKPNIDIDALLKGRFTVNPFSPAGKGEDGSDGGKTGNSDAEGGSNDDLGDDGFGSISPPAPAPKPGQPPNGPAVTVQPLDAGSGSFQGRPGPCQRRAVPADGLFRVIQTCPGTPESDAFGLLFRADDAADLATGRLELAKNAPDISAGGRSFRLGCSPWPCRSDGVVVVSVRDTASKHELAPRAKIALPPGGLSPTPGLATQEVPFPGLTALLAKKQLSGSAVNLASLRIICAVQVGKSCYEAVINVVDGDQLNAEGARWSIDRRFAVEPIKPETLAHRLLNLKCPPAKECDAAVSTALQKWQAIRIRASGRVQPNGLPRVVLAWDFRNRPARDALILVGEDGPAESNVEATVHDTWFLDDIYRFRMPHCLPNRTPCAISGNSADPLVPLLDELAAKPAPPIQIDHARNYAAASAGVVDAATLISTIRTNINGTPVLCSRSVSWSQIRTRLKGTHEPGRPTYDSDVSPELAKRLLESDADHALLLRDLVLPPTLATDGYRRSPLQLFPAPDLSGNCIQVISHEHDQ